MPRGPGPTQFRRFRAAGGRGQENKAGGGRSYGLGRSYSQWDQAKNSSGCLSVRRDGQCVTFSLGA